jgi:hypothetical protein
MTRNELMQYLLSMSDAPDCQVYIGNRELKTAELDECDGEMLLILE